MRWNLEDEKMSRAAHLLIFQVICISDERISMNMNIVGKRRKTHENQIKSPDHQKNNGRIESSKSKTQFDNS